MSAGLPGIGIGGLFFVGCALLMPLVEASRLVRGLSDPVSRKLAVRQAGIALAILAGIGVVCWVLGLVVRSSVGLGALRGLGMTGILLATVLGSVRAFGPWLFLRHSRPPRVSAVSQPTFSSRSI